jgi:integrase
MAIDRRPDRPKPWRARYWGPDGRQHSRSFARKAEAQRWLAEVEHDKTRGHWTNPAKGLAPATVQKCYQVLTKILAAAVEGGMLPRSPCREVPLPKVERAEMRFLTVAEVRRLAVAVGPSYRALILLGAYGGLRIGEMAGLRRKRLDLAAGAVEVAEVVTEMHGHLYLGPPKTSAGRRRVGLPKAVVEALQEHLAGRSSRTASCSPAPTVDRSEPRTFAPGCGDRRPGPRAWRGCASMICGIRRSPCGSPPGPVPERSRPGPGTPR